ncbi:MAG: PrsW family glutamic-type intramembrane protease [Candidatus Zambryskibacteria bacterium]|nr:PrsW family glutamic-type intramembrane protease [Candidatus Zambryskibacteria bacterium]
MDFTHITSFFLNNPYILAPLFGIIPALIWLFFWLKEDTHPEPLRLITLCFFAGQAIVFLALPLQRIAYDFLPSNQEFLFLIWAGIEEFLKFAAAWFIGIHTSSDDEPVDAVMYMIIVALGFVALENTLFLIDPLHAGQILESLVTGNLRFIGASLVHVISSAVVGIFLAFAFYRSTRTKILYGTYGVILATALHTYFNLFIMKQSESNLFLIFGFVWIGVIGLMLMFEKVKHILPRNLS